MIKTSIVGEHREPGPEDKFGFYRSLNTGNIVLFTGEQSGVVVHVNPSQRVHYVGYYSDSFVSCNDKESWERFNGALTIEQKD